MQNVIYVCCESKSVCYNVYKCNLEIKWISYQVLAYYNHDNIIWETFPQYYHEILKRILHGFQENLIKYFKCPGCDFEYTNVSTMLYYELSYLH